MARGTAKSSLHTTQLQTLAQVNRSGWAGAPEALLTKAQAAAKRLPLLCGRFNLRDLRCASDTQGNFSPLGSALHAMDILRFPMMFHSILIVERAPLSWRGLAPLLSSPPPIRP